MDRTEQIKQDIILLAGKVFNEEIPIKNICVSRAGKLNPYNRTSCALYESRLFSNSLQELACGGMSKNTAGALNELLKKIKDIRKQQLRNRIEP